MLLAVAVSRGAEVAEGEFLDLELPELEELLEPEELDELLELPEPLLPVDVAALEEDELPEAASSGSFWPLALAMLVIIMYLPMWHMVSA